MRKPTYLWGNKLLEEGVKVIYGVPGTQSSFKAMPYYPCEK